MLLHQRPKWQKTCAWASWSRWWIGPNWSAWNWTLGVTHPTRALWGHGVPPGPCAPWPIAVVVGSVNFLCSLCCIVSCASCSFTDAPVLYPVSSSPQVIYYSIFLNSHKHSITFSVCSRMESAPSSPSRSSGFVTPSLSPPPVLEGAVEAPIPEVAAEEFVHEDVVEIGIGDLTIDDLAPATPEVASLPSPIPSPEETGGVVPPAAPGVSGQEPTASEARGNLTPAQWRTKKRAERRRV